MTSHSTDTQAAPALLQARVTDEMVRVAREAMDDCEAAGWSKRTCLLNAIEAALDLSTPPQIAALEAEIVKLRDKYSAAIDHACGLDAEVDKLRGERDEARNEGYTEGRKYSEASEKRLGMILDHANARAERAEAEVARLTEAAGVALDALGMAGGTALGVSMSGTEHPDPDGVLMDVFQRANEAIATLRAAMKESTNAQA